MIVPGAQGWSVGIGRDVGDVEKDEDGVGIMRSLSQNIAWQPKKVDG
jgi:hypothetical protein